MWTSFRSHVIFCLVSVALTQGDAALAQKWIKRDPGPAKIMTSPTGVAMCTLSLEKGLTFEALSFTMDPAESNQPADKYYQIVGFASEFRTTIYVFSKMRL